MNASTQDLHFLLLLFFFSPEDYADSAESAEYRNSIVLNLIKAVIKLHLISMVWCYETHFFIHTRNSFQGDNKHKITGTGI